MVIQLLALVDALHGVQLILHLSLEIRSQLLLLPSSLVAVDEKESNESQARDDTGEGGDEDIVAAASLAPHLGPLQLIVLGVHLAGGQDLTDGAAVVGQTDAGEGVVAVLAEAAIEAGVGVTLIDLLAAVLASVSRWTGAGEVVDTVLALATVGTGMVLTVVIVVLAVLPSEPVLTHALVVVDEGEADALVLTRRPLAQVRHCLTIAAFKAGRTRARVS